MRRRARPPRRRPHGQAGSYRFREARRGERPSECGRPAPELLRSLEEIVDLVELLDGLVRAGHILEAHPGESGVILRPRLAEAHHLRAAALDLVHQEDPEAEEKHEREQRGEDRPPRARPLALRVVSDALLLQHVLHLERGDVARIVHLHLFAAGERRRDLLPIWREERPPLRSRFRSAPAAARRL